MKFCQKCGKQLLNEAVICPACGCPTGNTRQQINNIGLGSTTFIPRSAKTARTLGILAVLLLYPLGIPAIVYANKSKKETNGEFCGPAKAGFTCGIIALCFWGIAVLLLLAQ